MRKIMLLVTTALALAAAPTAAADTVTVAINRAGFTPNPARITAGDTVTWTNSDTRNRQVISKAAGFASPILKPGETYSHTFKVAGTFVYEETLVEPTQKGRLIVAAATTPPPATGTLTLAASNSVVTYGGSVRLSGELSNGAAGEVVEVLAAPFGQTTATTAGTKVGEVRTTAGGEFDVAVKPTIQTTYRVRWKTTTSGRVTIKVRPRIGLGIISVGRGIFSTKATSARSYAGRIVFFQRRTSLGEWVSLKRVRLGELSSARFQVRLPKGVSRVRVYMTPTTAGPGYLAGISASRIVRR
jgi:plastocyanin